MQTGKLKAKGRPRKTATLDPEWQTIEKFIDSIAKGQAPNRLYYLKETFRAALKLAKESPGTLNLKITATTLKELRYSFQMFFPYRYVPKITLFGSARIAPSHPCYKLAKDFGRLAVERKYMIITGGGPGAMAAGNEGAGQGSSFGLNIRLPFEQEANPFIDPNKHLVHYKYFYTRKLFLIKEAAALVLFPGGYGTFDEAFELLTLLQTGKTTVIPVVFLEPKSDPFWTEFWAFVGKHVKDYKFISDNDMDLFVILNSAEEALNHIDLFYKNYHSMRIVGEKIVIRIKNELSDAAMKKMNQKFEGLSIDGKIKRSGPLKEEENEPEVEHLPRLVFPWARRDYSGLRRLIDFINSAV